MNNEKLSKITTMFKPTNTQEKIKNENCLQKPMPSLDKLQVSGDNQVRRINSKFQDLIQQQDLPDLAQSENSKTFTKLLVGPTDELNKTGQGLKKDILPQSKS